MTPAASTPRPVASLSLDLDNQWSYMKTHGDAGWESYPSYLDVVVPRVLDLLAARGLTITFFVVGQDASLAKNHDAIRAIARAGHEIGNHSFRHEPWLHLYSESEIDAELARTEAALTPLTGSVPRGFRGPGFSLSEATLAVLLRRGYAYDCSTFPTYLGPLARAYYFATAKLDPAEREERRLLFGTFAEGRRPLKPYRWTMAQGKLLEIPVTTMPFARVPIHVSYLLYASMASLALARAYFRAALSLCRMTGTEPSILLHPLDFLGGDDVKELAFFPAMSLSGREKTARAASFLDLLASRFEVVSMAEHARRIEARGGLLERAPRFDQPAPSSARSRSADSGSPRRPVEQFDRAEALRPRPLLPRAPTVPRSSVDRSSSAPARSRRSPTRRARRSDRRCRDARRRTRGAVAAVPHGRTTWERRRGAPRPRNSLRTGRSSSIAVRRPLPAH